MLRVEFRRRRSIAAAASIAIAIVTAHGASAQVPPAPRPNMNEQEIGEHLVWSSPWEGRANPPQSYSYRTVFRKSREGIVAETVSYATNQRSSSLVRMQDGRINWQDSNGAEVNVSVVEGGDLAGTAASPGANLSIVFKPRR